MEKKKTIVAVFNDRDQAHRAINALEAAKFEDKDIGILQRQPEQPIPGSDEPAQAANTPKKGNAVQEPSDVAIAPDSDATHKTMTGFAIGGVAGSILGAAAALLVPGIGPVLAGGILTGALVGASGGMAAGGIIGALTELGLPESEAKFYGTEFEAGHTLVSVRAGDRHSEALKILQSFGGRQATTHADFMGNTPPNNQATFRS